MEKIWRHRHTRRRRKINEKSMEMSLNRGEIDARKKKKNKQIDKHLPGLRCFSSFFFVVVEYLPLRHPLLGPSLSLSLSVGLFISSPSSRFNLPIFATFNTLLTVVGNAAMAATWCIYLLCQLTPSIIKNMMLYSHHNCYSLFTIDLFCTLIVSFFLLLNTISLFDVTFQNICRRTY